MHVLSRKPRHEISESEPRGEAQDQKIILILISTLDPMVVTSTFYIMSSLKYYCSCFSCILMLMMFTVSKIRLSIQDEAFPV